MYFQGKPLESSQKLLKGNSLKSTSFFAQVSFNWKMQNKCPDTFKALKVILKDMLTIILSLDPWICFRATHIMCVFCQVFEGTGIKIVSDLPFLSQCETVIDANNVSFFKHHDSIHVDTYFVKNTVIVEPKLYSFKQVLD